ncbi:MAG: CvpA family protein [Hahellaceae bacterium]|nr:CvpA family protein [Hahellaceae bacterium]MCP5212902.1 CvpA family protein [Hahellaceae bacterium]
MDQVVWADWAFLAVIGISGLLSLRRGFVKECLSLASWIVAFIVARLFTPNLEQVLVDSISTPSLRYITAFAVLFICVLLVGALISRLVCELVKVTGLSTTDRILGMFFGLARGIILSIVAVALLRLTPLENDAWWHQSIAIEKLQMLEKWSRKTLDESSV